MTARCKNFDILLLTALMVSLIFIDLWIKNHIEFQLPYYEVSSFLKFDLIKNYSLAGNLLENFFLPKLRVLSVIIGLFFVLLYTFINYFLSERVFLFRVGLSLVLGGILANLIEKFFKGYVVDFIALGPESNPFVFNFADLAQWPGYVIIIYYLFFNNQKIWPKVDRRNRIFISSFQRKSITSHCLLIMFFAFMITVASNFLVFELLISYDVDKRKIYEIIKSLSVTILYITFPILLIYIWFSLKESHKFIGPLYAVLSVLKSKDYKRLEKLNFRKNDHKEEFFILINEIKKLLTKQENENE